MKIHFIGIGGIGVSALAQYYLAKGHRVSGSDLASSETIEALKEKGVKVLIGKHKKENLPQNTNLVIYSLAVSKNNPELKAASKIQKMSYPEALGELTKKYFTIAVSGTHGKSTTTAMIGLILVKAGLDPTVIVGTKLKEFNNLNFRVGNGAKKMVQDKYLVIEADEHFASFLNYWPKIIVLTNIEADHLDYYRNFKNYKSAFKKFISRLPQNGYLIANKDDKNIYSTFLTAVKNALWYSLKSKEKKKLKKFLRVPGEHNISNALAALTAARALKIPDKISFKALSEYKGSWRRFEEKELKIQNSCLAGRQAKFKIINDYAHHPTAIKATLKAAREKYPKKKIWCFYQPHQYQRTYYLFNDFVKAFREIEDRSFVDKLIITDIYDVAGREEKGIKNKINSEKLAKWTKRKNVIYLQNKKILDYLKKNLADFEILIMMGAGDIYKILDNKTKIKENKNRILQGR